MADVADEFGTLKQSSSLSLRNLSATESGSSLRLVFSPSSDAHSPNKELSMHTPEPPKTPNKIRRPIQNMERHASSPSFDAASPNSRTKIIRSDDHVDEHTKEKPDWETPKTPDKMRLPIQNMERNASSPSFDAASPNSRTKIILPADFAEQLGEPFLPKKRANPGGRFAFRSDDHVDEHTKQKPDWRHRSREKHDVLRDKLTHLKKGISSGGRTMEPQVLREKLEQKLANQELIRYYETRSLLEAIKKQLVKFEMDFAEFHARRFVILWFIEGEYHGRKVDAHKNRTSEKHGWANFLEHYQNPTYSVSDFDIFGQPHVYLQVGPDISIILASNKIATSDEAFAPISTSKDLASDTNKAMEDKKCILDNESHFGSVVRVDHMGRDVAVKVMKQSKIEETKNPKKGELYITLESAENQVFVHRLLCQIDDHSPRAKYPVPFICQFLKVAKDKDEKGENKSVYFYGMELGSDVNILEEEYIKKLKKWMHDKKKQRMRYKDYTKTNISPYERKRKRQIWEAGYGILFMHMRGCTHNDVKYNNLCIKKRVFDFQDDNQAECINIIDFGQALYFSPTERDDMLCDQQDLGTPLYRSPEAEYVREQGEVPLNIELRKHFSPEKNDTWALGLAMFSLYFIRDPFTAITNTDLAFLNLTRGTYVREDEWKEFKKKRKEVVQKGIWNLLKPPRGTPKNRRIPRQEMVTEAAVNLMHRIFVPEKQRISMCEFLMDDYFNDIRQEMIDNIQKWQQSRFGDHDDIKKILDEQLSYEKSRQVNDSSGEKDYWAFDPVIEKNGFAHFSFDESPECCG